MRLVIQPELIMRIKIEFEVEIPDNIEHTDNELEEFLRFEFRDNGSMSGDNPFKKLYIEPVFGTFYWSE